METRAWLPGRHVVGASAPRRATVAPNANFRRFEEQGKGPPEPHTAKPCLGNKEEIEKSTYVLFKNFLSILLLLLLYSVHPLAGVETEF